MPLISNKRMKTNPPNSSEVVNSLRKESSVTSLDESSLRPSDFGQSRMPKKAPPLSSDEIQLIKNWIDQGARNN